MATTTSCSRSTHARGHRDRCRGRCRVPARSTLSTAYDAIEGIDIDGFAISNRTTDDIEDIVDHVTAMWQPAEKHWRWGFVGDTETLATATALAEAANDRAIIVGSVEASPSMPFEVATALAVGAMSRERPNANYDGMKLPIYPPPIASAYTGTEVEAGIAAGLTCSRPSSAAASLSDQCKVERMVTTKTVDDDDNPFLVCRDLAVPRTARSWRASSTSLTGAVRTGRKPRRRSHGRRRRRPRARHVAALWRRGRKQDLTNVDADLAGLVVEADEAPGRFNVDAPDSGNRAASDRLQPPRESRRLTAMGGSTARRSSTSTTRAATIQLFRIRT